MKHILILQLVLICSTILLAGCGTAHTAFAENALPTVITALENSGHTVQYTAAEPFFLTGERSQLVLDNDPSQTVVIYTYDTPEAAAADAAAIRPDGSGFDLQQGDEATATCIEWADTPHFYRCDDGIVLYVGHDPELLSALKKALGPCFAGGDALSH